MKLKIITISFILTLMSCSSFGQTNNSNSLPSGLSDNINSEVEDSIVLRMDIKKNYWLPFIEITGINLSVFAYNKFFTKEGWSNISINSIKSNFTNGFAWDHDGFLINQFTHPYHGATYFNSARTNGLGFWESAPYTVFGSLSWEYFMEIDNPSYNDIVNTPITGIILGEISYRVSDLIIDESARGFERFGREVSILLINPVKGFTRLFNGRMWAQGASFKKVRSKTSFSFGVNNIFIGRNSSDLRTYGLLKLDFIYGDEFKVKDHKDPFDYFSLHTEASIVKGDNIVGIFASGVIWDGEVNFSKSSKNLFGIYKEIDILINTTYKLSATSITGKLLNHTFLSKDLSMNNNIGVSGILMGGTNSQYSVEYNKDYNLGPGASANVGINFSFKNYGEIYANYKQYWIHTLSGAESEEYIGLFQIGMNYNFISDTYWGVDMIFYNRFGDYKYFPDTHTSNSSFRIYVKRDI